MCVCVRGRSSTSLFCQCVFLQTLKMRGERSLEMVFIESVSVVHLHTHTRTHTDSGQSHPPADTGHHTDVEREGDN